MASFWNIFVHKHYITNPIVLFPTLSETYTGLGSQNKHQPEHFLEISECLLLTWKDTLYEKRHFFLKKCPPKSQQPHSLFNPFFCFQYIQLLVLFSHLFHNLQIQKGK